MTLKEKVRKIKVLLSKNFEETKAIRDERDWDVPRCWLKIRGSIGPDTFVSVEYIHRPGKKFHSVYVISQEEVLWGWDTARHHPTISSFPYHVHEEEGINATEIQSIEKAKEYALQKVREL